MNWSFPFKPDVRNGTHSVTWDCCLWTMYQFIWLKEKILHLRLKALVERSEKLVYFHVVWMLCVLLRFTPGAAAQLEKKRTGPSQADVEAIKVNFYTIKYCYDSFWIVWADIESNPADIQAGKMAGLKLTFGMTKYSLIFHLDKSCMLFILLRARSKIKTVCWPKICTTQVLLFLAAFCVGV